MATTPSRVISLAAEIARSWGADYHSKLILIAPPLSNPRSLFKLLEDPKFLWSTLGDQSNRIRVARLGERDFTQDGFMRKLAVCWGRGDDIRCSPDELYGVVESSLEQLRKDHQIPVLLVERFHSGLEQLSRDFGIQLRDLENDFRINTVVELPIRISDLRKQLEYTSGGCPFLQSNWSDGYESKWLRGYSQDEVQEMLERDFKKNADFAKLLYRATSGLPVLISALAGDLDAIKDCRGLEKFLRAKSKERCERFFNWLDIGDSTVYQNLLFRSLTEPCPDDRGITLASHSWKPILLNNKNELCFWMLAWASAERKSNNVQPAWIKEIFQEFENSGPNSVLSRFQELAQCDDSPNRLWKCATAIGRFFDAANPTGDAWRDARSALNDLTKIVDDQPSEPTRKACKTLNQWKPVIDLMLDLQRSAENWNFARIGEQVCKSGSDAHLKAYLQLLKYQIDRTCDNLKRGRMDPHAARSTISAVPESVMQLYCWKVLSARFWDYEPLEGIGPCEFLGHENAPPTPGKRLDFRSMLLIQWQKRDELAETDRLIPTDQDYRDISVLYGTDRSVAVHEFTPIDWQAWERYYGICTRLIERFWRVLACNDEPLGLPDLATAIAPIKEALLTPR